MNIYVRLHIISHRVTGGYTGKANSCKGAWVPTVLIHRPISFLKFTLKEKKKLTRIVYGRGVGEKPCKRVRGGKREGKGNPRNEGNRGGRAAMSSCRMIKERKKAYND